MNCLNDQPMPHTPANTPRGLPLPLLLVCGCIVVFSIFQTGQQLAKNWPIHQWESGILAESQRAATGLEVFEAAETGHATHMYGPATTFLMGACFRITGPSFLVARWLSVVGISATMLLLTMTLRPRRVWIPAIVAATSVAAFGPGVLNFAEPRPDCISLAFAAAAVIVMAIAWTRESRSAMACATALTVVAMLFKQPAAMVAAVPFLAALLNRQQPLNRRRCELMCWPLAGVGATLLIMFVGFPTVFHYCVEVPSTYSVSFRDMLVWSVKLLVLLGCCSAALLAVVRQWKLMLTPGELQEFKTVMLGRFSVAQAWTLAALSVTVPCCLLTASKTGGNANCLLPAVVAAAAVIMSFAVELQNGLYDPSRITRWLPMNCASAMCVCLVTAFGMSLVTNVRSDVSYGDAGFAYVVKALRDCDGIVACPQDPAAAVLAGRRPGRSLMLEYDAAGWPTHLPQWIFDELLQASVVVTVGRDDDWRFWPVSGAAMEGLIRDRGFVPDEIPALKNSVYRVWRRPAAADRQRESSTLMASDG